MTTLTTRIALTIFIAGATLISATVGADEAVFNTNTSWVTYYVKTNGDDANDGTTKATAFKTINHGIAIANSRRRTNSLNARLIICNGLYRSANFGEDSDGNTNQIFYRDMGTADPATALVIEAETAGGVVIRGSEVFTGWANEGGGVYSTTIPFHGTNSAYNYLGGGGSVPTKCTNVASTRRELVFFNSNMFIPASGASDLDVNEYYAEKVSATEATLYIKPPSDPNAAYVEVGCRPTGEQGLFRLNMRGYNIAVRGIVVEHAASTNGGQPETAFAISSMTNVLVENCSFNYNNQVGSCIALSKDVTVRGCTMNSNGWKGMNFCSDTLITNCEFSWNNWRGSLGGEYPMYSSAGGIKAGHVHNVVVASCTAYSNIGFAIWFDTSCYSNVISGITGVGNVRGGVYSEKNPGPFLIERSYMTENGRGILIGGSWNTTITSNVITSNVDGSIGIQWRYGQSPGTPAFQTIDGTDIYVSYPSNTVVISNYMVEADAENYEFINYGGTNTSNYNEVTIPSFFGESNIFYNEATEFVFHKFYADERDEEITLYSWKTYAKTDSNSRWLYAGETNTIVPTGDTFTYDGDPNANYGTENGFTIRLDPATYIREGYISFDLRALDAVVTYARLELTATYIGAANGSGSNEITLITNADDGWDETSVTWNNAPETAPGVVKTFDAPDTVGEIFSVDITALVASERSNGGILGMRLTETHAGRQVKYATKEYPTHSYRPRLIVIAEPPDTTAPTVTASHSALTTNAPFTLTLTTDEDSGYFTTNGNDRYAFTTSTNIVIAQTTTLSYYGFDGANTSETNTCTFTFASPASITDVAATLVRTNAMTRAYDILVTGDITGGVSPSIVIAYRTGDTWHAIEGAALVTNTYTTNGTGDTNAFTLSLTWSLPLITNANEGDVRVIVSASGVSVTNETPFTLAPFFTPQTSVRNAVAMNNPCGRGESVVIANIPPSCVVRVYTASLQPVAVITGDRAGYATWDAKTRDGVRVGPGVYFCVARMEGETRILRVIIRE